MLERIGSAGPSICSLGFVQQHSSVVAAVVAVAAAVAVGDDSLLVGDIQAELLD